MKEGIFFEKNNMSNTVEIDEELLMLIIGESIDGAVGGVGHRQSWYYG